MKKKLFLSALIVITISAGVKSQTYFRSGIFLHHSTGGYIWGPNPDGNSTTTIPEQMHLFNTAHNYSGADSITLEEEWWSPDDNEWATQHEFFEGNTAFTDINHYLNNYKIIVVKSCFPSSEIYDWGQASDTLSPGDKTVYNYKWHWRHIIKVMKNNPGNFFAIWTNAPLEVNSTTTAQAALAKKFCKWAKDTLAAGLDPVIGAMPKNVYVFDYFNKMTGANGIELPQYVTGSGDSHPNGAGTDFIAPQFVNEIFAAAVNYEQFYMGIAEQHGESNVRCFPNPVSKTAGFLINLSQTSDISLTVFDSKGNVVYDINNDIKAKGFYHVNIDFTDFAEGLYFYRIAAGNKIFSGKLVKQ